jgi:hypothetical protein
MRIIGSKAEVKLRCQKILLTFDSGDPDRFVAALDAHLLKQKIRFPLLEFAARELFSGIPEKLHYKICDRISELNTIGGNVILGIVLQMHLEEEPVKTLKKAGEYMNAGDEWYVCDIIAERVMGVGLLKFPETFFPLLQKLTRDQSSWVVRSVGVATHYAVKKGLEKTYVEKMFLLLLSLSASGDFHVKTGAGWGAKTCAKFYPDLIEKHKRKIEREEVGQWFKTKIKIGLGRAYKYSGRY